MKIIMCQPAIPRFQWEVDTAITSIRALTETPIVLLFISYDQSVIDHFKGRYTNLEIHGYPDGRPNQTYPATTRPYLMAQYLAEDSSREKETYFQIDCDVIFREWPDFDTMKLNDTKRLYGSDCGGYIDYDYLITRRMGPQIICEFANKLGTTEELIKATPGAGAQWVYTNPTAELWGKIWADCDVLYTYLQPLDSNIQKWTAEMWSQLYNFAEAGWKVEIHPELDFCRPTDPIAMWEQTKILHNAGVIGEGAAGLLYKGKYTDISPFHENLDWVRRDKAGRKYADAVDKAAGKR